MTRDPRHDILFEPVRLGPRTMRNRFYQAPHCTGFGTVRPLTQAAFRGMKAEGGWAAVNTEFCSVHPSSDATPAIAAHLWDDDDARNLALMAEHAHAHDALAGVELWYGGCLVSNLDTRWPARSVSQMTDATMFMTSCSELDHQGIREIQGYYVAAAIRARDAGFDIVNVHGAEGAGIPVHFLMSRFNKRTDEYGGSLENRARFWMETLEQVRAAVGDDCAITARLCVDSRNGSPEGIRAGEEAVGFIEMADHLVDFWDLQAGGWIAANWIADDATPSRHAAEFHDREYIAEARRATRKPVASVGRFTNPDTMAEAVRSGVIDIVAAARPSISDPFLPKKIEEGRYDEIRECIGCNVCASRFPQAAPLICTQNATAGEEYRRGWHPERFSTAANADRDVLVLGAGPAGLECARVLGERGMSRIHLVDAAGELGGSMRAIRALPGLGEWGRVIDYRAVALDRLRNVEVILSTELSAEQVLTYGAEIVVVATGARWRRDGRGAQTNAPIPGAAGAQHVYAPEQVMEAGGRIAGDRVLVYDTDGYFMATGMAQLLVAAGKQVTVVTPFGSLGPYMVFTGESPRVAVELVEAGAQIVLNHSVVAIDGDVVHGASSLGPAASWQADAVVLVTQREPCDSVYRDVLAEVARWESEGIEQVHRIGDCAAPRMIADCVFDGHRLAREIDSEDPAVPLPHLREFRVVAGADREALGLTHDGVAS
jgi:dimethylamine/trimethylamine dehydrogenase